MPDFFDFAQMDKHCCKWAPIIRQDRTGTVLGAPDHELANIEDDCVKWRTPMFLRNDEIVFRLASIAFKDSLGGCHFVSKRGVTQHSGCKASLPAKDNLWGRTPPDGNAIMPAK